MIVVLLTPPLPLIAIFIVVNHVQYMKIVAIACLFDYIQLCPRLH